MRRVDMIEYVFWLLRWLSGLLIPGVLKVCIFIIFKDSSFFSFEMPGINNPATQHANPEDMNHEITFNIHNTMLDW
jgi:hypothetical protein